MSHNEGKGPYLVDQLIGTSYDTVKKVAEALPMLEQLAELNNLAMGPEGPQGYTPQKGIDYFDGQKGNVAVFIYKNASAIPSNPMGGQFDGQTLTPPTGWSDTPTEPENTELTYISTCYFIASNNGQSWYNTTWSTPARISGPRGYTPVKGVDYFDGKDGSYRSAIFKSSEFRPAKPTGGTFDGVNESVPTDWTDNPTGATAILTVWMSEAVYREQGDGSWAHTGWSEPLQFSGKDGQTPIKGLDYQDGKNGNFISFVFKNASSVPSKPTGGSYDGSIEIPPTNWTDDPTLPATGEFTYVSKQTYLYDETVGYVGQGWSEPARISGEPGKAPEKGVDYNDGLGRYTSYIFKTGLTTPLAPVGGTYNGNTEVIPDSWFDDPVTPDFNEAVYMAKTLYREQTDGSWINNGWSAPTRFSGFPGADGANTFSLVNLSDVSIQGDRVVSLTDTEFGAKVISTEYYSLPWSMSARLIGTGKRSIGARNNTGQGMAWGSLAYEIRVDETNVYSIYEEDVLKFTGTEIINSDVLGIIFSGDEIIYQLNGENIYTSLVEPTGAYAFGGQLSKQGDSLTNISVTYLGRPGANGVRGSKHFYAVGSVWSDAVAEAAITNAGESKVLQDIVTISNNMFAETRYWEGTVWVKIAATIDGNLLVQGTVSADAIDVENIFARELDISGATYDLRLSGTGSQSPISIRDKQGSLIFGFDSNDQPYFKGGIGPDSIKSQDAFSFALRDQLFNVVQGETGGNDGISAPRNLGYYQADGLTPETSYHGPTYVTDILSIPYTNATKVIISGNVSRQLLDMFYTSSAGQEWDTIYDHENAVNPPGDYTDGWEWVDGTPGPTTSAEAIAMANGYLNSLPPGSGNYRGVTSTQTKIERSINGGPYVYVDTLQYSQTIVPYNTGQTITFRRYLDEAPYEESIVLPVWSWKFVTEGTITFEDDNHGAVDGDSLDYRLTTSTMGGDTELPSNSQDLATDIQVGTLPATVVESLYISQTVLGGVPGEARTFNGYGPEYYLNRLQYQGIDKIVGTASGATVTGDLLADAYNLTSDARLKNVLGQIDNPLARLALLKGVEFKRKDLNRLFTGLIAQDVEKAINYAVTEDNGIKGVDLMAVVALLVEAVNTLNKKIEDK